MNFNINDALNEMIDNYDDDDIEFGSNFGANENIFPNNNANHDIDIGNNDNSPFSAQLYAVKKKKNKVITHINKHFKDDTICLPVLESQKLFLRDTLTVELKSPNGKVMVKVTKYNSDPRTVQLPQWIFEKLNIQENTIVQITEKNIKPITKISVSCPKEITNSLLVLEFEIRNRNLLYKNDVFCVKMFEKEYRFTIDNIYNKSDEIDCGLLYENSLVSEIFFDINIY